MVLLNRHHNKHIFSCLCLWGGGFTRILYFGVQTGTKTGLFLVVKIYGMVLLLAPCPSMYKQGLQSKRPQVKTSPSQNVPELVKTSPKIGQNVPMVKNVGQNVPKMNFYYIFYVILFIFCDV